MKTTTADQSAGLGVRQSSVQVNEEVSIPINCLTPSDGMLKFLDDSPPTPARKHLRVMVKRAAEKNKYLDISSIESSGYGCRTVRQSDLQEKEAPILMLPGPIFSTLVSSNYRAVRVLIDILQEENRIHPTSRTMMQIVINGMKRRFSTLPAFEREPGRCYCGSRLKRIPVESLVRQLTESETCISICSRSNQKIHQCRYT